MRRGASFAIVPEPEPRTFRGAARSTSRPRRAGPTLVLMNATERRCFVCGSAGIFSPSATHRCCYACGLRIAELAMAGAQNVWADEASPSVNATPAAISATPIDPEAALDDFRRGVAKHIAEDDAEPHFDLAQAYCEMGLYLDARREAAIAVRARGGASTTDAALRLLLTPPLLEPDGLRRLRERLRLPH